ncbi:MAG: P63C domain-containing protein [Prolixibacteraceae bacterium]|jgi:hypothetical protein|nr:P63C domain-containing protein [Prolixibacteraceae bacterium]
MKQIAKADYFARVPIGNAILYCGVLDDETRVISERSLSKAFGIKGGGAHWARKKIISNEEILPEYVSAHYLAPFVSDDLKRKLLTPIQFVRKNGAISKGFAATVLPEICDVFISAKKAGVLNKSQEIIADNAYILLKGFATVGIIALIDEATGFQEVRQREALQKILDKYLKTEYAKWASCFPLEFYEELFRLKGWTLDKRTMKMPQVVGRYTNDVIYERLAPGILSELQVRNPILPSGRRKTKHHQWLTDEIGHPALDRHFTGIMALMRANSKWENFKRGLERAYPKMGSQLALRLFDDDET